MKDYVNQRIVLLCSGGIDSTVLLYRLLADGYDVFPLYINYGQTTVEGELKAIDSVLPPEIRERLFILEIPNLRKIGTGTLIGEYPEQTGSKSAWYSSEFFPNRNIILLSLAATYSHRIGCKKIAIGVVGENSYPDTSTLFLNAIKNALSVSLSEKFTIIAPYADRNRSVVIDDAKALNVPLDKTFSCNALGDRHCFLCISCHEREQALNYLRNNK